MIEPGRVLMVVVLGEGWSRTGWSGYRTCWTTTRFFGFPMRSKAGLQACRSRTFPYHGRCAAKNTEIPESLLNQILYETYVSIKQADNINVYMEGSNKMLGYPEFNDIRKAKTFMDTIAEHGVIAGYLDDVKQEMEMTDQTDLLRKTDFSDPQAALYDPDRAGDRTGGFE